MANPASRKWDARRSREALKRFWRSDNPRVALTRDILIVAGIIGFLLASVWVYSGQPFPNQAPLVVVESGSMMHGPDRAGPQLGATGWENPPFGRIGTIDPGDLVFVKKVSRLTSIETAFGGGSFEGYGAHGDVIVFRPFGSTGTPIIHRAMLLVMAVPEGCTPGVDCVYRVPEACSEGFALFMRDAQQSDQELCAGTSDAINVRLERGSMTLNLRNYPCESGCGPFFSSYITMGDNNPYPDQFVLNGPVCTEPGGSCNSSPVRLDWIVGKSRGEVPWFGLIKLALYGNERYQASNDPTGSSNWHIFAARAPWDIWLSLFMAVGLIATLPMALDFVKARLNRIQEERDRPRSD